MFLHPSPEVTPADQARLVVVGTVVCRSGVRDIDCNHRNAGFAIFCGYDRGNFLIGLKLDGQIDLLTHKQFGISLAFTPTILQDGLINMVVNPEVSSIDPTTSIQLGDISIPGIKVRRAHTTVELRDGESFTVAGLLSDDYQSTVRQYPWLGDLPIIGSLFRSTGYQQDQTELVIVVTPHLVTPKRGPTATPADTFVPPSDFELFLFGNQRGKAANLKPEDRALMSADPGKGGLDGPYGHVLY